MSVKRWTNWCAASHGHRMSKTEDGEFVLASDYDALRAAAGKVTCRECNGSGIARDDETNCGYDCPDCSPLRALLTKEKRP